MTFTPNIPNLVAAGLTASVILAPMRLGIFEIVRPTILVMLPCLIYLLVLEQRKLAQLLMSRLGFAMMSFGLLLTAGHLLSHDLAVGEGEEASILSVEGIWVMLAVFIAGIILADSRYRRGIFFGLALGMSAQLISLAIIPSSIDFRGHARSAGMMKDPNIMLIHIIPAYFLWIGLIPKGRWQTLVPLGLAAVYWATLQTLSRAGLVSLLAGTVLCILPAVLAWRMKFSNFRFAAGLAAVVAALVAGCYAFREFVAERLQAYLLRSQERLDTQGSFLADRLVWLEDIQRVGASGMLKPFGVGYDQFQSTDLLPHNTFIDVLVVAGPVAFLLFCLLFGGALWNAGASLWRRAAVDLPPLYDGAILAATSSHFLMLVTLSVLPWKVNWLLLGLCFGLLRARGAAPAASAEPETEEACLDPAIALDQT